jgi:hypothetical protein
VEKFRTTDRAAAEELFNACYPRLAGWVRRLVDDGETAHEIAAEAFTRLLSRWSALDNPQSYLYMIATNLVRDHWRKTSRERRAIRTITATVPREPSWQPAQDVDVRALIEQLPPTCPYSRTGIVSSGALQAGTVPQLVSEQVLQSVPSMTFQPKFRPPGVPAVTTSTSSRVP